MMNLKIGQEQERNKHFFKCSIFTLNLALKQPQHGLLLILLVLLTQNSKPTKGLTPESPCLAG